MRSEKEVYDIVLNFAKTDKRIRMVTLEGSRTNTNIPPDDFQDFDITFCAYRLNAAGRKMQRRLLPGA